MCYTNTENKALWLSFVVRFTSGGTVVDEENECCICMERKAEVILACGHNFCEICIDSWTRLELKSIYIFSVEWVKEKDCANASKIASPSFSW